MLLQLLQRAINILTKNFQQKLVWDNRFSTKILKKKFIHNFFYDCNTMKNKKLNEKINNEIYK